MVGKRPVATTLHTDGTVLLVADAETGSSHRVAPDDDVTEFAWGDDRLAYRFADRETKQVGVVDVDTGDLVWRTTDTASTHSPAWLDDGRLLFVRLADGRTRRAFVAVDIDDGTQTVLFAETDAERGIVDRGAPAVSPDGTTLAAALALDGWAHVHAIDVVTGDRTQLTEGEFEDKGVAGAVPQWSTTRRSCSPRTGAIPVTDSCTPSCSAAMFRRSSSPSGRTSTRDRRLTTTASCTSTPTASDRPNSEWPR